MLLISALALLLAPGCATPIRAGWQEFEQGDHLGALEHWLPLAEQGDAEAQFLVGVLYEQGQGVALDLVEAARWYRLGADQAYAPAQNNLGLLHLEGRGVSQQPRVAARWFARAARQDYPRAQNNLAILYLYGFGVEPDDTRARELLLEAASGGDEQAQATLVMLGLPEHELDEFEQERNHATVDGARDRGLAPIVVEP